MGDLSFLIAHSIKIYLYIRRSAHHLKSNLQGLACVWDLPRLHPPKSISLSIDPAINIHSPVSLSLHNVMAQSHGYWRRRGRLFGGGGAPSPSSGRVPPPVFRGALYPHQRNVDGSFSNNHWCVVVSLYPHPFSLYKNREESHRGVAHVDVL
jgi:hypothetical protein